MNTSNLFRRILYGIAAVLVVVCTGVLTSGAAWAHGYGRYGYGPRVGFGIVIGPPYGGYYPYPPPYYYPYYPPQYYPPPVVVAPPAPPVYVEKGQPPSAPQAPQAQAPQPPVWYYCPAENGYYPYVRQCPEDWQIVPAQPPPPTR